MSATLLILLLLGILGGFTFLYYFSICYPIYKEDKEKDKPAPPRDPETERILPPNTEPSSPPVEVTIPSTKKTSTNPYPNASDLDMDAEMIDPVQGRLTLDEPDSNNQHDDVVIVVPPKKVKRGSPKSKAEKQPLLEGDDEDGLIVPNKKPIIVMAASRSNPDISSTTPEKKDHVVVNMSEPQPVPEEKCITKEHPVSHVVVSVPHAMSASMPVYDESSEVPTCTSVQDQHLMATLKLGDKGKACSETNVGTPARNSYGWSEELKPIGPGGTDSGTGSKDSLNNKNETESDTSETDITSYSFTKDEEPANEKEEPNVTMIRYISINEGADASVNDSMKVHVDPSDDNNRESRQSPDGLSVKSLETDAPPPTPTNTTNPDSEDPKTKTTTTTTTVEVKKEVIIDVKKNKKSKVVYVADSDIL